MRLTLYDFAQSWIVFGQSLLFLRTISNLQVAGSVTVDPEALEKIKIVRADFMHALEHDIKPAFGSAQEYLDTLVKVSKRNLLFQELNGKYYRIQ